MTNPHFTRELPVRLYEAESSVASVAAQHGFAAADVIDFSLNVNPFGPPASAVAAASAALARSNAYPDVQLAALRRAVAARHGTREANLFFGAGLDDVIKEILHAWTAEGDAVMVHLPTFPRYELEAYLRGCRVVAVTGRTPWHIDVDAIGAALARERIALAFLCTPNNPTGEKIDAATIAALARRFPETILVVDEALLDPREAGVAALVGEAGNVVQLRTFSKYYGLAGFRVGYAHAPASLVAIAERGRPPFNVALPSEAAALAALGDRGFIDETFRRFREAGDAFCAGLSRLPAFRLRGRNANMLLIEVCDRPARALQQALEAKGIVVADAACFGGMEGHAAFRVSLRDPAANERLLAALGGVAAASAGATGTATGSGTAAGGGAIPGSVAAASLAERPR